MCTLTPAFFSANILKLATDIVECKYTPINSNLYSQQLISIVNSCLTVEHQSRPDIIRVAQLMTDKLMIWIDDVNNTKSQLSKETTTMNIGIDR
jgi:NIMA (never in mitosis gene a)-related kinase